MVDEWDGKDRRSAREDRLVRIEDKLDKLSDAVIAIARTEEQITTIFSQQRAFETKLNNHEVEIKGLRERAHDTTNKVIVLAATVGKIDKIEKDFVELKMDTHDNTMMTNRIEKISWIMVTFILGIVGFLVKEYILK